MENYLATWKALEELTITLKKSGVSISDRTMEKLRSARATISIYETDPTYGDTIELIGSYLGDLEAELVSLGEQEIGKDFADEWVRRITEARHKKSEEVEATARFIPGVPRSDYWIRVRIGDTVSGQELRDAAARRGLSTKEQEAEFVIVHGEENRVKQLVREIAKKMRKEKGKT